MIYLDYNATTPLLPEAQAAMLSVMAMPSNPSSMHGAGRAARATLDQARRIVAESVSAFPREIIFTASGTESNAMAMQGFHATHRFTASTEHSSLLGAAEAVRIGVDAYGQLNMDELNACLAALPQGAKPLVSVMLANNETGVMQPVRDIAAMVHAAGGWMHTDAAQALGKTPLDMGQLGADAMTLCAHKFGGPVGAAALVVRQDITLAPLLKGGGQESRRRAGTENVPAIAGFAAAIQHGPVLAHQRGWLDAMEARLKAVAPKMNVAGQQVPRLPNTSCLSMPGVNSEVQLMHFDLGGIALSAGAACTSGRTEPSHVLQAMGWSREEAGTAIRLSLGWDSREADIQRFESLWLALYARSGCKAA